MVYLLCIHSFFAQLFSFCLLFFLWRINIHSVGRVGKHGKHGEGNRGAGNLGLELSFRFFCFIFLLIVGTGGWP
ncbi:hypothetical protein DFH27DRAFT_563616 [Peziza echinospora]|nr:hypothetical protein DFH27DRAFT_563616 [Peziza echinospora]